jgi:transposase
MKLKEFLETYPNDDVCLDKLFKVKYGKLLACPECGVANAEFKRIKTRRCYQCVECGYQLYPTAGTVFEKTTTPLKYWFFAMYLMTTTRNGVAAKELQRSLGVTYKTAWRMAHQIRELMNNKVRSQLSGEVTMDETYIGGQERYKHKNKRKKVDGYVGKTPVFAMLSKDGQIIAGSFTGDSLNGSILKPVIREHVEKGSTIITDGFGAYSGLDKEYNHEIVNHETGDYANKRGYTTNSIENYFSSLKRMIKGTHIHVSQKHLPNYIAENTFRFENRNRADEMFEIMLKQAV